MTLHPIPSEFPYIYDEKFYFFFNSVSVEDNFCVSSFLTFRVKEDGTDK
jgi:hypothetical protein